MNNVPTREAFINKEGFISINRLGKYKPCACIHDGSRGCGDWCHMFSNVSMKYITYVDAGMLTEVITPVITTCNGEQLFLNIIDDQSNNTYMFNE